MAKTKKEVQRIKKPFLTSAISLIVFFILIFLTPLLNIFEITLISATISIINFVCIFLLFGGYYYLGRKHKSKLLMNVIIIGFVLFISSFIFFSYYTNTNSSLFIELNETLSTRNANLEQLIAENVSNQAIESYEQETLDYLIEKGLPLIIPFIIFYFIYALYLTSFGIGMIRLEKVKYSKAIGILTIISVWLIPTLIGIFLAIPMLLISYILSVIMFFDESYKSKE